MRRLVELGGALLAVAASGAVHAEARADPAAPQLNPGPGRREDAQRLQEQLQGLEPPAPRSLPPLPPAEPTPAVEPRSSALGTAGVVLLCVAGGAGASAAALSAGSDDGTRAALLVTAAVSAAAGLTFVLSHRSIQAAPAVAPHAVGVAIAVHL
ncbi:MAG TPA: hypothetical protein VHW23_36150 [Kofleriaceae bacterium]|jgi:hypothetical protein|nr:hypothetical protein [Kofleriaceae bacterium]